MNKLEALNMAIEALENTIEISNNEDIRKIKIALGILDDLSVLIYNQEKKELQ